MITISRDVARRIEDGFSVTLVRLLYLRIFAINCRKGKGNELVPYGNIRKFDKIR